MMRLSAALVSVVLVVGSSCTSSTDSGTKNRAPTLEAVANVTMTGGQTRTVLLRGTDPDGNTLTFTASDLPTYGTLSRDTLTFSPPAGVVASQTVTVSVSDGTLSDVKTFQLTVNLPDDLPPTVSALTQVGADGTSLMAGASVFVAPRLRVTTDDDHDAWTRVEVEVALTTAMFTGRSTASTMFADEGVTTVALPTLPPGEYHWRARASDESGLSSAWSEFSAGATSFTVAASTVTGTVAILAGATATNQLQVALTLQAQSTGAAVTEMRFSSDGTSFSAFQPYATSKTVTLEVGDGEKTVTVEFKDALGRTARATDSIILDTTPPAISAFVISNGATFIGTAATTLTATATDTGSGIMSQVASNDGFLTSSTLSGTAWTLSSGDGVKTVSLRVTDGAGNATTSSDTIIVDTTAPTVLSAFVAGGGLATAFTSVTLQVSATDGAGSGVTQLCVGGVVTARCEAFGAGLIAVTLPSGEGTKAVQVTVKDAAGFTSAVSTASVVIDTTPPTIASASINNGATLTNSLTVRVSAVSTDAVTGIGRLAAQNPPDPYDVFMPYAGSAPHTLAAGTDGVRTINVKIQDGAGNVSTNQVSASITVDQTPPTGTVAITGGLTGTRLRSVPLTLTATDLHGVSAYCAKDNGTTPAPNASCFKPMTANGVVVLNGTDEVKTISVWYRDSVGNVSAPYTTTIAFDGTPPAAPSALRTDPAVTGNVFPYLAGTVEADATVRVFADSSCNTAALATGSAADFNGSGFVVTPPALNALNTFYLNATDLAGNVSACSAPVQFRHDTIAPAAPVLGMSPTSPSTESEATLSFSAELNTVAKLYGSAGCTGPVIETLEVRGSLLQYPFTVEPLQAHAFYVTATDAAGNVSPCAGISYVNSTPGPARPVYAGRESWGRWIKRDGSTWLNATNTECDGYEAGGMAACLHAGLMRSIAVPRVTSCAGVVATDSLNAFQWQCVQLPGAIKVFSAGLKEEKNLSDLLDFDTQAWRPNSVSVTVNGAPSVSSDTNVWFSNSVVSANSGSSLSGDDVVFVQSEDVYTNNMYFQGQRAAYVMRPGKKMTGPTGNWLFLPYYGAFQWIEGDFSAQYGWLPQYCPGLVLRNVRIASSAGQFGQYALYLYMQDGNVLLHNVVVTGAYYGIYSFGNPRVTAVNLTVNGAGLAIYLQSNAEVRFTNLLATNSYSGLYLYNELRHAQVANVTIANSQYQYLNGYRSLVRNFVSVNNASMMSSLNEEAIFEGVVVANTDGISTPASTVVLGDVRFGTNSGGTAAADCGGFGGMVVSGNDCIATGSSTFGTAMRGRSIAASYFGKVTTDDALSPDDSNGATTYENLTRGYLVENRWRTWGFDGSAFPNSDTRGYPSSAGQNIRIWDWRPNPATDSDLLNTNVCPKLLTTPGFTWKGQQVLRNSWERFDDGLGDDDGLCESGEACVFSRNKGAYQGSGTLVRTTVPDCLSGTGFSGIIGYEYQNP